MNEGGGIASASQTAARPPRRLLILYQAARLVFLVALLITGLAISEIAGGRIRLLGFVIIGCVCTPAIVGRLRGIYRLARYSGISFHAVVTSKAGGPFSFTTDWNPSSGGGLFVARLDRLSNLLYSGEIRLEARNEDGAGVTLARIPLPDIRYRSVPFFRHALGRGVTSDRLYLARKGSSRLSTFFSPIQPPPPNSSAPAVTTDLHYNKGLRNPCPEDPHADVPDVTIEIWILA